MNTQSEILIDCNAPVFIPDGCLQVLPDSEQLPNRVRGQVKWDTTKFSLYLVDDQKNGKLIGGNKLRKGLGAMPVLTAHVLDFLIKPENQYLIPEEWKRKLVFFWGTIYRRSDRGLCVRYLCWGGGKWYWGCGWLDDDWGGSRPAVCSQV
ncbi:MAG: hypothetical protein WCT19_00495 [Candidatus Paceibacterota bacterium]